jgi:murein L,D-transpeptidase YcbB/YkuD
MELNGLQLLRKGSNGTEVRELQKMLNKIGYDLNIDGDFGTNTESAVKHFQKSLQLTEDGIVGSITYNAIVEMSSKLRRVSMDIDKALEILFNEKVISDKNYWKLAIDYQQNIEQLLKNMAERLL